MARRGVWWDAALSGAAKPTFMDARPREVTEGRVDGFRSEGGLKSLFDGGEYSAHLVVARSFRFSHALPLETR